MFACTQSRIVLKLDISEMGTVSWTIDVGKKPGKAV
jgi:hypothetical protein